MTVATCKVPTQSGGKYVQQLCKHWGHKFETTFAGDTGTVQFPASVATMVADDGGIAVTIEGQERETVERMTKVLADHLDRFAFREAPLTYDWHFDG